MRSVLDRQIFRFEDITITYYQDDEEIVDIGVVLERLCKYVSRKWKRKKNTDRALKNHSHEFEFETHNGLKEKAKKFLEGLGFETIIEEYRTGVRYSDYYFIMDTAARVDVAGFKGDRIALVECGDTPSGKLRTLARHFEEVYHLPYYREITRVKREPPRNCWEMQQERINLSLARAMGVQV